MKYILALALALASLSTAFAADTGVPKNLRVQAGPAACVPFDPVTRIIDWTKVRARFNGLALYNGSTTTNTWVTCSPLVDVSGNGTVEAGLYVSNNDGGTLVQTVTCTATYNTAGQGPKSMTKSVMVSPNSIAQLGWQTSGFDPFAGPVTIYCNLKPLTGAMRVYTIHGNAS